MKPEAQGLYSPEFEHDNCGAGFICNLNGVRTNDIIHKALTILIRLEHRGAVSSDGTDFRIFERRILERRFGRGG
jgi:glutamate synthase (ferredoxin)